MTGFLFDLRRNNGGLTSGRAKSLSSDERLAIALHDLDAANHYDRCSFARTWAGTRYGERYEDNPMGCIGLNRTSRDRKRHFEDWLARVEPARRVAAELGIADILLGTGS
jgi:hypothetical protein